MALEQPDELPACPICGTRGIRIVWRGYPGYQEPGTFDIADCGTCRTRLALPLDVDAASVYAAIYRQAAAIPGYDRYVGYAAEVAAQSDPLSFLAGREPAYWGIREALSLQPGSRLRILEVGSGLGYLTHALRSAGHDASGIDISAEAVSRARERFGPYYEAADIARRGANARGEADVVVATEVIEHLSDPLPFLAACLDATRAGGALIVTTPNRDCYAPHVTWAVDSPPVHLLWLTEDSLAAAAGRLGARLEMVDLQGFPGAGRWRLRAPRPGHVKPPVLDAGGRPKQAPPAGGETGRRLRSFRKEAAARLRSMLNGGRRPPGPSPTLCAILRRG